MAACQKSADPAPTDNSSTTDTTTKSRSDSATVTVVNGYGSGRYKIGDAVNIWASAIPDGYVFDQWTGYSNLLQHTGEWHNSFVMPAQDVTVTGVQKSTATFSLKYEKIQGVNILKNVYYYFPATQKGAVFLLHGSGGSALNLVTNFEWSTMIKDLVAANYAIIVTEAEESSLNTDLNGDGNIRWKSTPVDSTTNVDYGNIKAIRDTFYARGVTNATVPLYSIGMSNGGAFSSTLSWLYKFTAGISYCAQGYKTIFDGTTNTPFQFCMAKYDDQSEVGPAGNAQALANTQTLTGKGVCSKYFEHDKSPVYPQRFARRSDFSIATSTALFNELKNNNWLDGKNYLKATSDSIATKMMASPSVYPTYNSLNALQRDYVNGQIDDMCAAHQFYSDLNKTTIKFLTSRCQ
jgi:hypothetical protein